MNPLSDRRVPWLFLVLATFVFIARGPMRTPRSGDDLVPQYAGARAWLFGEDPYRRSSLRQLLLNTQRETDNTGEPIFNWSLYPPPTFVAMAPLAVMSWPAARLTFLVLTLALFLWHLRSLLRLAGLTWDNVGAVWLVGGVVALAPYHTGIALAQMAIPSVAFVIVGLDQARRHDDWRGGVLLAMGTLFKPQLAAPFVLYCALRGQKRAAAIAVGVCVLATLIGVGWLEMNDVGWWESWRHEQQDVRRPGGHHDPAGPWSAQLLELRPLITAVTRIQWSAALGFLIAAILGVLVYVRGRRLGEQHDLLLLSAVCVLTLLATYHRFYDAAILCLPLSWAARTLWANAGYRHAAIAVIACCAVFFVPGAWMLQRFANEQRIPAELTNSFAWNVFLLRHQNWALIVMIGILVYCIITIASRQDRPRPFEPRAHEP